MKIQVAAAGRDNEGAVNGGRPDEFAFDQAFDVFEDGIAIVAGFGEFGVSAGAEENGIRAVDTDKAQLAKGLGEGFRVLAHVGGQRFPGIAGALPDADDSGGVETFENGAVFSEGELTRGVLCRLPIGIVGAAFHIVNHLAVKLEGNTQLDQGFRFPLPGCDAVAGLGDRVQVAGAHGRESGARRALNVRNAAACEITLDGARGFFFDLGPRGIGNRSQLAMQVIHWESSPFKEPMPSEPFLDGAVDAEVSTGAEAAAGRSAETLSRKVTVGMKNRFPVTAVLKSRMRS